MPCEFRPDGYVSFESALSVHGVLDDVVHVLRIATVSGDRSRVVPGLGRVEWAALPDDLLFGDEPGTPWTYEGLRVAGPEKALCDLLWLCESRGMRVPIYSLRLDGLDWDRLRSYADTMLLDLRVLGSQF